jgi:hypothetical protein
MKNNRTYHIAEHISMDTVVQGLSMLQLNVAEI